MSPHRNKGNRKTIGDFVKSRTPSKGFMRLTECHMPEVTLEHLVVENDHDFSEGVVDSALEGLVDYAYHKTNKWHELII